MFSTKIAQKFDARAKNRFPYEPGLQWAMSQLYVYLFLIFMFSIMTFYPL